MELIRKMWATISGKANAPDVNSGQLFLAALNAYQEQLHTLQPFTESDAIQVGYLTKGDLEQHFDAFRKLAASFESLAHHFEELQDTPEVYKLAAPAYGASASTLELAAEAFEGASLQTRSIALNQQLIALRNAARTQPLSDWGKIRDDNPEFEQLSSAAIELAESTLLRARTALAYVDLLGEARRLG